MTDQPTREQLIATPAMLEAGKHTLRSLCLRRDDCEHLYDDALARIYHSMARAATDDNWRWGAAAYAYRDAYRLDVQSRDPRLDWSDALPAIIAGLQAARPLMPGDGK